MEEAYQKSGALLGRTGHGGDARVDGAVRPVVLD